MHNKLISRTKAKTAAKTCFHFPKKNKKHGYFSMNCFESVLNFPVRMTNHRGNPSQTKASERALFTPAVNVSAPLIECTSTEITVGQPAVGAEGARPSDLDSSHTSSAAGPLAQTKPLLIRLISHSVLIIFCPVWMMGNRFFKCLIFQETIATVWQIPFIWCSKVLSHNKSYEN